MREFKLQAWNKLTKRMGEVTLIRWEARTNVIDRLEVVYDDNTVDWVYGSSIRNFELREHFGYFDKNRKPIYTGDILKTEDATAKVVFWESPPEFGLDFSHNEDKWCEDWNLNDDGGDMEIIGNEYEDPELLL